MPAAVIIPAAGQSSRFGGNEKKPFASLDGRPVWQRSAELFWSRDDVARVYLVLAPGDRDDFRGRFGHLIAFANIQLVDGGDERFDSVANALDAIGDSVELIAVHDAVRPLAPAHVVDAVFAAAAKHGAAMPAIPVADTLKRVDPAANRIVETIPRANLWQAQTPQVFKREWLAEAYAKRASFPGPITDDAQLVEAIGYEVKVVPGSPANFKITTKEDLELAEAILKARASKKPTGPALGFHEEAQW
jgi:2-C-methyl-D-erythritol 4-phosphate cytidylyltransferase